MAKETRSVLDAIREDINKSNNGAFKNFFKIRESGAKVRVRFLQNFEDCSQVIFHDKWNGFNHPCLTQYDKECPNCNNPEARTSTLYAWNIYNYETKQVEIFMYKANKATPIFSLMSIYEVVGDITQQDIVITRNGTGTGTTYQCTAVPKATAFDKKVKLNSEKGILKMCLEAFNRIDDESLENDDDDDDTTTTVSKPVKAKTKAKSKPVVDDDDDDFDEDEEDEAPQPKSKAKGKKKPAPVVEEDDDDDEDFDDEDEDDEPPFDVDEDEEEEEEEELPPPRKKSKKSK